MINYKQGVDGCSIHLCHFSQGSMVNFFHAETYKEIPGQFSGSGIFGMFGRKINFHVGEHPCTFCRVYPFQLYQCSGVGTETVFFQEERYENTIQQAD